VYRAISTGLIGRDGHDLPVRTPPEQHQANASKPD
jgi:hypothetical protein